MCEILGDLLMWVVCVMLAFLIIGGVEALYGKCNGRYYDEEEDL